MQDPGTGRSRDLTAVTAKGLLAVFDWELDTVVLEAIDQTGFMEGSSWSVHSSPVSNRERRCVITLWERRQADTEQTEELHNDRLQQTQQKGKRNWPPGERVQFIQQGHGCLYQSGNCPNVTRFCEQEQKHTRGVKKSQKWSQRLFTALNIPEAWGCIYSMRVTDMSAEILDFSYCQQIPWKDRKTAINWSDWPAAGLVCVCAQSLTSSLRHHEHTQLFIKTQSHMLLL